jgi:hypothetical protein
MARSVVLALAVSLVAAKGKDPPRLAWVGIVRGPMAPARANRLESLLIDELDGHEGVRLVDAGGMPLDERLVSEQTERASKLRDEGVQLLLAQKYEAAAAKLDQAIALFESQLLLLSDYEILDDALLAKAEALSQSGKSTTAKETLQRLAALSPSRVPTKKTHPPAFVELWERAKKDLGPVGRAQIEAEAPACTIALDGKALGASPQDVTKVPPGKHYVVARWPFFTVFGTVEVSPGRDARVVLARGGPAEQARLGMLESIEKKEGIDRAQAFARRIADRAQAEGSIVAVVRSDGEGSWLFVGRHDDAGKLVSVARLRVPDSIDAPELSSAVRKLAAELFSVRATGDEGLGPIMYGKGIGAR